ncbi:MAG: G3E family GTPase [Candidatus Azotimanducaceae bacterium]
MNSQGHYAALPDIDSIELRLSAGIDVIVLTGFLGSGKTTLIRRFLADAEPESTVVIVNEFGEIGLDHLLVESSKDSVFVLDNGCICCSSNGDLEQTLLSLLDRRERGELPRFTKLVIETTGLAHPQPVINLFYSDEFRLGPYSFVGLVTVVDAVLFDRTQSRFDIARDQIALADKIIVSKADLVSAPELADVLATIRKTNFADVELSLSRDVTIEQLLWNAMDPDHVYSGRENRTISVHSNETSKIFSITKNILPVVNHDRIVAELYKAFRPLLSRVLRFKAILTSAETGRSVVIHGAQHLWSRPKVLPAASGIDCGGRVMVIGEDAIRVQTEELLDRIFDHFD